MKIGFVCGAFDLLHAGHVYLLNECKRRCDYLVVGLHVDPSLERKDKNKPIESILERQIQLIHSKFVNDVVVYEKESDIPLLMQALNIDVRFLGSDYAKRQLGSESNITAEEAVPIKYIESLPIHTSDIRERIKKA